MSEEATVYETSQPVGYHSRHELSSSEVACYLTDPIVWYHRYCLKDWPRDKPSEAMQFGTMVHRMIEIGGCDAIVKEIPAEVLNEQGHCKGKTWLDWKAANPADCYIKPGEPNPLKMVWDNLQANTWCRAIIENAAKETEHFWHDADLASECRMKCDAILNGLLIDWKTTSKTNARTFAADAAARFYDVRLALYRRGFRDKFGCDPEVCIVAIATDAGCKVTPYRMPDSWLEDAEARLILAVDEMSRFSLDRYLDCGPVDLVQPRWATFDLESVDE
jgi:hypothetical protein